MRTLLLLAVTCGALAGCATSGPRQISVPRAELDAYLAGKPASLRKDYERLYLEGARNEVLNNMRLGLRAFELGEDGHAEQAFDHAMGLVQAVFSDTEDAQRARSLWYAEDAKTFKGEPYERAMLFYYVGLLKLKRGDYQTAKAAFKNAMLQDAFAEEEQNRCDFAVMAFLHGWANQCAGDYDAALLSYGEVARLKPGFVPPAENHNTLVLAELGKAPRKLNDGISGERLVYRRSKRPGPSKAHLRTATTAHPLFPVSDVAWQAMSRGGRMIDFVLADKMHFKKRMSETGQALGDQGEMASILYSGISENAAGIGAAVGVLGGLQQLVASNAKPRADVRAWDNLPETIHVTTVHAAGGEEFVLDLGDDSDPAATTVTRSLALAEAQGGHGFVWLRAR